MQPNARVLSPQLTAVLVAPDRTLAAAFAASQERSPAFQVLADIKSYPSLQTLEIRLKQVRPDVLLLDVESNQETAGELIRFTTGSGLPIQVVGLHSRNDHNALLACLRLGASEFLYGPFDPANQREAVVRLLRLRHPETAAAAQPGCLIVFSSVKSGSGATTLAVQTACALRKETGQRVLLADFDVQGGMIAFFSKLNPSFSLLDALESADQSGSPVWASMVVDLEGVDVLAAPESPFAGNIDPVRLNALLDNARMNYDWVLIDLPVIFERLSLMVLSNADKALLVSTADLPSLHLARKAVQLLDHLGFPKDRFEVLVNRVNRKDDMARADIEKLFQCPIEWKFPNDYFSLHRVVALGQSLDGQSELGKTVRQLAAKLSDASHQRANATQPAASKVT